MRKIKIIRATTVPISLNSFCKGELKSLNEKYEVVALSSPGEDLDEVQKREGVRTIAIPMDRRISILHDVVSLVRIIKAMNKEKPYMVHSMTPKAGLLCMIAAWITRVPVRVHTFTGLVFPTSTGFLRKVLMGTDFITCYCATHIVPEGKGVKADLLNHNITNKPMKVLGYGNGRGVDMEYYSFRDEVKSKMEVLGLRADCKFTFLFVGRIVKDKGIKELCEAFDLLSGMAEVRLFLVGGYEDNLDPISQKSREIIEKNKSIIAVGRKTGDELLAYYAASDCYVSPSYREGFPNTVLEAGAMGLPCIVTDINGSREIIIEGENGVIIPSHDSKALFEAMYNMKRDKVAREKMAGNARKMIGERFEQSFVRKCLYDFYDEVLNTPKLRRAGEQLDELQNVNTEL